MEYAQVSDLDLKISRITLGTWAIGGWMWGGTDERNSIDTILEAIDQGVTTIDTAPVYGFGKSEELVGKAVQEYGQREKLQLATKVTLDWDKDGNVFRNGTRKRIMQEIEDSLNRLQTDYIDIYQVHWPDFDTPMEETAGAMKELFDAGKIKAIGVSNFKVEQMKEFQQTAPIHINQPPYNLFEQQMVKEIKGYCDEQNISLLTYGALCRGLLSGKMSKTREFKGDDLRNADPKFQGERFDQYLKAVDALDEWSKENYDRGVLHLASRWILDTGITSAIWGARNPEQVTVEDVFGWKLNDKDLDEIQAIVDEHITDPVGPEFMAPPKHRPEHVNI
jgi:aryl-alcohol dehydrogenase-like predicted oxidoreductase